jgi:thiosulfate/3-mercaptopyruvate sulfurtransferase
MLKFKRTFTCFLLLMFAFSLVGCGATSSSNEANEIKAKPLDEQTAKYYVNTDELKENLKNVVIIDARAEKEYKRGHIPGAINITWQMLSNMNPKQGEPGWGVVLGQEELGKKLGSFGIDGKKSIVVYNDPKGLGEEGRVLWMLKIAGLNDAKILNGGWPAWEKVKGEVSKDAVTPTPVDFTIAKYDDTLLATTEYVKANKDKVKLLDARSPEEYAGKTNHGEKALGRIPGAISLPYNEAYNDDGTIKSIADLKALFEKAGLKPEDQIITYCTVGIRSGFLVEILKMAGYDNARNYNASFSEWSGAGLPVEK